jgi:hypothetical protein
MNLSQYLFFYNNFWFYWIVHSLSCPTVLEISVLVEPSLWKQSFSMDLNTEVQSRFQEQNSADVNKMCYWIKPCCGDSHKQTTEIRKHLVNLFGASWPYILAAKVEIYICRSRTGCGGTDTTAGPDRDLDGSAWMIRQYSTRTLLMLQ